MPKKSKPAADAASPSGKASASAVKDSAQQIWLAGLGAFAKAQEEGGKVFEALVKEGLGLQRKTQAAATEATSKMATMAQIAGLVNGGNGANGNGSASGLGAKVAGPWDKLENIFEDRVAKALAKLGMPSAQDMQTLIARVEELNQNVLALSREANTAANTTTDAAPTKAPAKRPSKKQATAVKPANPTTSAKH